MLERSEASVCIHENKKQSSIRKDNQTMNNKTMNNQTEHPEENRQRAGMPEADTLALVEKLLGKGGNVFLAPVQLVEGDGTMNVYTGHTDGRSVTYSCQQTVATVAAAPSAAAPHYPLEGTVEQGMTVMQQLVEEEFIAPDTDEASWLYLMGYTAVQPASLRRVVWLKNVQLAQEMLRLRYRSAIDRGQLTVARLTALAPLCFSHPDGEALRLAKNKEQPSVDSDRLKEIFG